MLSGNYINYKQIIDRVFGLGIAPQFINEEEARELIFDILSLMSVPSLYTPKVSDVTISEYLGKLPCDYYNLDGGGIRHIPSLVPLVYSSNVYHISERDKVTESSTVTDSTDNINSSILMVPNDNYIANNVYTLHSGYVEVAFYSGTVEMSYNAFPTDDNGMPIIPDNIKVVLGVTYGLAQRIGFSMYMKDQISEAKYNKLEQLADWYMGAAQNSARMPNADKMDAVANNWLNPVRDSGHHMGGFRYLNNRPRWRTHN